MKGDVESWRRKRFFEKNGWGNKSEFEGKGEENGRD